MASMYKRLHHKSFMLFAVLIFSAFAVIIIVSHISTNKPNLLMAAFGLSNGVFSSEKTPAEGKLAAAPIITTTKNSTLSILSTIPLGYGQPESIAVNPKTNTIYLVTTHYDTPSSLNSTTYKNNIVTVIDGKTNKVTGTITVRDGYKGIAIHQLDVDAKANKVYATGDYIVRGEHLNDCFDKNNTKCYYKQNQHERYQPNYCTILIQYSYQRQEVQNTPNHSITVREQRRNSGERRKTSKPLRTQRKIMNPVTGFSYYIVFVLLNDVAMIRMQLDYTANFGDYYFSFLSIVLLQIMVFYNV